MRLPITESLLRGELRPQILGESLSDSQLSELMRHARSLGRLSQLSELEAKINEVIGPWADTRAIYADEKQIRDAALKARTDCFMVETDVLNPLGSETLIGDVLALPQLATPLARFYHTIIDAETRRSREAMRHLYNATRDTAFMRDTLKKCFRLIARLCHEAQEQAEASDTWQTLARLLSVKLTSLYFTLLNTYGRRLRLEQDYSFEQDFATFVYDWSGAYPSADEEERYAQQCASPTEIAPADHEEPEAPATNPLAADAWPAAKEDAAARFIKAADEAYNFLQMPLIKALGSMKKVHTLVTIMLSCPGHACAMLEHLRFFEWMRTQKAGIRRKHYDIFCATHIMKHTNNENVFRQVRASLKEENANAEKYKAYTFISQVAKEYDEVLNA